MPRIFVAEPNNRYDITAARAFGPVVFLSDGGRLLNPLNPRETVAIIEAALRERKFDPDEDYLCLTGYSLTIALVLSVVSCKHRTFKVLMFDSRTHGYVDRPFAGCTANFKDVEAAEVGNAK